MSHMFVLFVNYNGFINVNDHCVNIVTKARMFCSREEAEEYRAKLYNQRQFHNTISILEWL